MKTKDFLTAIEEFEQIGISREITIQALKEAFESTIRKKGFEDQMLQTIIDPDKGVIEIYTIQNIVPEVTDDALEISEEDAQEIINECKGAFISEEKSLYTPVNIDDFSRADATKFKSIFKQKIKEAEKANIYAAYSDKVGEIVTGYVEKVEDRYTLVNLGRTSVILKDIHKIGDEVFKPGDAIKVYLSQVNSSTRGPQILVSRSEPGFLKRLFEEEVHDVFDGTVIIKDIAREAGERSKVSVTTNEPNVDPVGSCIGQGGSKIQKICSQINHEKIDIVQYHVHPGLFIAEALKPATCLGVNIIIEEEKKAVAIVKDGDLRVAIGKKGVNAKLAVRLTGYHIDIVELAEAEEKAIEYKDIETMKKEESTMLFNIARDNIIQAAKDEIKAQEEITSSENVSEEKNDNSSVEVNEEKVTNEEVSTEKSISEVKEVKVEKTKEVDEEPVFEYKPKVVGERVTLSELEKQLDEEKKKNQNRQNTRKPKKEEVKEEKKEEEKKVVEPKKTMAIYTDEELKAIEEEEDYEDYDDDDEIDYEEYDQYYEE